MTLLKGDHTSYRAVITDIKLLGRYDGWDVARAARGDRSRLSYSLYYRKCSPRLAGARVPNSIILQKPFTPAQLVTAISLLLNTRQTFGPATI